MLGRDAVFGLLVLAAFGCGSSASKTTNPNPAGMPIDPSVSGPLSNNLTAAAAALAGPSAFAAQAASLALQAGVEATAVPLTASLVAPPPTGPGSDARSSNSALPNQMAQAFAYQITLTHRPEGLQNDTISGIALYDGTQNVVVVDAPANGPASGLTISGLNAPVSIVTNATVTAASPEVLNTTSVTALPSYVTVVNQAVFPNGSFRISASVPVSTPYPAPQTISIAPTTLPGVTVTIDCTGQPSLCAQPYLVPTVSVSPPTATLMPDGTQQFTALVAGVTPTTVTWSVQEGNSGGTVSSTGLYTAPATTGGPFHVVATSVADPSASGSTAVTVSHTVPPPPSQVGRFLYSTGNETGRVIIHTINATTGQLRFRGSVVVNPNSPIDLTTNVVLAPSGQFLYAEGYAGNVYGFTVSQDGQLTPLAMNWGVKATGSLATVLVASSQNSFLYGFDDANLFVAQISPTTGLLGDGYLINFGGPGGSATLAFDSLGRFAYFGLSTGILGYSIDPNSGGLNTLSSSPFSAGASGSSNLVLATSPNGSYLYAANANDNKVYAFSIAASGALTLLGSVSTGNDPVSVAVDPSSRYLFVSNYLASTVSPYVIQSDGTLSAQAAVPTGAYPSVLAVDPSGEFLYVADSTGSAGVYTGMQTFQIGSNATLTALQAMGEPQISSVQILGGSMGVTYSPQFLYVAGSGISNVSAYQVDPSSGGLTQVTGSPYSAGSQPLSIATDLLGRFVYAPSASGNPGAFSGFTITGTGANAGALTPVSGMPAADEDTRGVVVEPSGTFAYAASSVRSAPPSSTVSEAISEYTLDPTTGLLSALSGSPFILPNGGSESPHAIATSASGFTVFVTNTDIATVSALSIEWVGTPDGTLSQFTNSPILTGPDGSQNPVALAVDPSNRFLYVANAVGQTIAAFQFNDLNQFAPISGAQFIFTTPTAAGTTLTSIAVEPTGRFFYAAVIGTQNAGVVVTFAIDATTGALSQVGSPLPVPAQSVAGMGPVYGTLTGLTADPSGKYLYAVLNNASSEGDSIIIQFDIDASAGTLTLETTNYDTPNGPAAISITSTVQ